MAITSTRTIKWTLTGATQNAGQFSAAAASNGSSPGNTYKQDLSSGANTITKPTGATAVTIIPPVGNVQTITLKGITGDTGVLLHPTDPTSIGLGSALSTFVLTAGSAITGVTFVWT